MIQEYGEGVSLVLLSRLKFGAAGHGAYGEVYKGSWHGNAVAIKVLRADQFAAVGWAAINSEAQIMASLRHPNIVTFFGAGITPDDRAFIISELMTRGSLRLVLDAALVQSPGIAWVRRLAMCKDIAAGMRFLHGRTPPLVHRYIIGTRRSHRISHLWNMWS